MKSAIHLLLLICLGWVWAVEVQAQTPKPEPPETVYWLVGFTSKLDSLGYDSVLAEPLQPDGFLGLQLFRRQAPFFGTGASILFAQADNAMEIAIDGRFFLPLPLVEPYLGMQLSHMTRDNGGVSLALRPGVQIHIAPPATIEAFGLLRFDLIDYLERGESRGDQLRLALGAGLYYRF